MPLPVQDGRELEVPLYVVVNRKTASAAEVLTASLQENKRAVVLGEQTFHTATKAKTLRPYFDESHTFEVECAACFDHKVTRVPIGV